MQCSFFKKKSDNILCVSTPVSLVEQFHVNTFKQSKPTTPKQSQLLDLLAKQEIQLHHSSMHNTARMTLTNQAVKFLYVVSQCTPPFPR